MVVQTHAPEDAGGALCREHADTLTPMRGWSLEDRRDPVPRLFRVSDTPAPAVDDTPSRGQRRRPRLAPGPSLLDHVPAVPAVPDAPRVEDAVRTHVEVVLDATRPIEPDPEATQAMEVVEIDDDEPQPPAWYVEEEARNPRPELRYERDDESWGHIDDDPWAEEAF